MKSEALSLVFTGRLVDLPHRPSPRFPPELVETAQRAIQRTTTYHMEGRAKNNVKGFASLARGGDIIFDEICRNLGFDTDIVLPFSPNRFLKTSVEGAEVGDWTQRFC